MARRAAVASLLLALVLAPGVSAADTGGLLVTCWPGYEVFLDGEAAGTTVVEQDGLFLPSVAAGLHTVRVERDGYLPFEAEIEVPAGGLVELKVGRLEPAAGAIRVVAEPGRRVYLDGRLVGLTTGDAGGLEIVGLEAGGYELRVEKLGYEAVVRRVEVPAGGVATVPVEGMAEVGDTPPAEVGEAPMAAVAAPGAGEVVRPERPAPVAAEAPVSDLPVLRRTEDVKADVLFGYRARGRAIEAGGTVAVHRERGGPRSPVMVFWCVDRAECLEQTSASFPPGSYRFRVNCRPAEGDDADRFLELDAGSGSSYLVDVTFDAPGRCTAEIVEVDAGE